MPTKHIAQFQFIGSSISKVNFNNTLIHLPQELKRSIDVDYHIDNISQDDKATIGLITLIVDMSLKPKKNIKGKTSINLRLQGCFSSDANVDTNEFEELLQINGTSLLYSIARSIIQSLTSQAFLNDSVAVPMINLYDLYLEKKEQLKVEQ